MAIRPIRPLVVDIIIIINYKKTSVWIMLQLSKHTIEHSSITLEAYFLMQRIADLPCFLSLYYLITYPIVGSMSWPIKSSGAMKTVI